MAPGMSRATSCAGFDLWQTDLAIQRDFPLHDRLKLKFQTEAFNLLNRPNFGNIGNMQLVGRIRTFRTGNQHFERAARRPQPALSGWRAPLDPICPKDHLLNIPLRMVPVWEVISSYSSLCPVDQ